ncbi:MAG: hypothetical protein CSA62_08135 [Planctomycetota bacterium]|nr:MAG: hypothetical protein CSA62_08135 [Planctomycetota bacterium]
MTEADAQIGGEPSELPVASNPRHEFRCNVCGEASGSALSGLERGEDQPSCGQCGASLRVRSLVHALSLALFGRSMAIVDFPVGWPMKGHGLSEPGPHVDGLAARMDFSNSPPLPESVPGLLNRELEQAKPGSLDFLIVDDVLEQFAPPRQSAFNQAVGLLRPGAVLIFALPAEMREPEPGEGADRFRQKTENEEGPGDLPCNGAPGASLTMPEGVEAQIRRHLAAAGMQPPRLHKEAVPEFGIPSHHGSAQVWAARRPLASPQDPAEEGGDVFFDQHSRYASLGRILCELAEAEATVLDVGSGEGRLLERYVPGRQCSYLDPLLAADQGDRVLAGGFERLAREERRWDWLVSVDTLEHIPKGDRESFLQTLMARSRVGLIVSGPCEEDLAAREVDTQVNASYRAKTGRDYPWLAEHEEFGLPSRRWLLKEIEAAGFVTHVLGNGNADWLGFLLPYFVCYLDDPQHMPLLRGVNKLFNEQLYPFEHLPPHYRSIVVATRAPMDFSCLAQDASAELQAQAARAWREFQREFVSRLSLHADSLAQRPPRLDPNPFAKHGHIQDLERELAAVREELRSTQKWAEDERVRAEEEQARADKEQARADKEQTRADKEQARAEGEQARAEDERARVDRLEATLLVRLAQRLGLLPKL